MPHELLKRGNNNPQKEGNEQLSKISDQVRQALRSFVEVFNTKIHFSNTDPTPLPHTTTESNSIQAEELKQKPDA